MFVVGCGLVSRDEVARVISPDGRLEAILIETNGGATTAFGYEIWLREKDRESRERVRAPTSSRFGIASCVGARRVCLRCCVMSVRVRRQFYDVEP
jgi:hypothetical protein